MPSIGEVNRDARGHYRRQLALGIGLLLAGSFLAGLGAAGTVSGSALRTGLVIGGLAVLLSLWGFARRITLRDRERSMAVAGSIAAMASLPSLWVLAPSEVLPRSMLVIAVGLIYTIGITVLLAAILAGITLPEAGPNRTTSRPVSWTRSPSDSGKGRQAADGGREEDDLSFPIEDD